ncbi:hypothetical protein K7H91_20760 [Martelella mediterranea]|uniref:hypothetical protein n=1 Tax=Martelella mediterranea TaxID=293089 RepID=UPI001E3B8574|nr:hypothetical protein [Martelella mediterranea]MCD1636195.1 hypothetical protein [Martelella mediterranea]
MVADKYRVNDLGASAQHQDEIARLSGELFGWARRQHSRTTISDEKIDTVLCKDDAAYGVYLGFCDQGALREWSQQQAEENPSSRTR